MSDLRRRLARIEQVVNVTSYRYRPQPDVGAAREKLSAMIAAAGGRQVQESFAAAAARIMGITTRELLDDLRERADA